MLARLMYGQRVSPDERRAYLEKPGAFWELIVDPTTGVMSTRFGKLGQAGSTSVERLAPSEALKLFDKKVAEKTKGGYRAAKEAAARQ